jgi:hypothetical protein
MTRPIGEYVVFGFIGIVALVIAYRVVVPFVPPHESARRLPEPAQAAQPHLPAIEQSWLAMYNGHYITCETYTDGTENYIVMPNPDEMQAGAQPVVNYSPSPDSWQMACTTEVVKRYR